MSASKDKILRRQQMEAGTYKRSLAEAEAAKKRRKSNLKYTIVAIVVVLACAFVLIFNSNLLPRNMTAVTIDGQDYSVAQMNYYYSTAYMGFYNNYYQLVSYFFDPSLSLADQEYSEGYSWHDYFMDAAVDSMTEIQILTKAAEAAGFVLPEDYAAEYASTCESMETAWADYGYSSLEQYISLNYGKGVTLELAEQELYRNMLAAAYAEAVFNGFEYSTEELDAYYAEHADEYDVISYAYYAVDSIDVAQTIADAVKGTDEAGFAAYLSENYEDAEPVSLSYAGNNLPDSYSEWLLESGRSLGDTTAVESETGTYAVMFLGRDSNDYTLMNFRHILLNAEDTDADGVYSEAEIAAAQAEAETVYAEWQAGAATEDSFAELANTYSDDTGSNTTGGLYEDVYKDEMVESVNDWLFAEGRKAGDTGIVINDGSYTGAHILYFVGAGDMTYAQTQADNTLRNEAYSAWMEEAESGCVVTTHHLGMCGKNH